MAATASGKASSGMLLVPMLLAAFHTQHAAAAHTSNRVSSCLVWGSSKTASVWAPGQQGGHTEGVCRYHDKGSSSMFVGKREGSQCYFTGESQSGGGAQACRNVTNRARKTHAQTTLTRMCPPVCAHVMGQPCLSCCPWPAITHTRTLSSSTCAFALTDKCYGILAI